MDNNRINLAIENIKSILVDGETLIVAAPQHRLFTIFPILTGGRNLFFKRRDIIAITSERFIYMKRNLIRGFDIIDIRYQDISKVIYNRGIFAADFKIYKYSSTDLTIYKTNSYFLDLVGYDIEKTQEIYKYTQKQEEAWREKRRIRGLEELRAKSGSINNTSQISAEPYSVVEKNLFLKNC